MYETSYHKFTKLLQEIEENLTYLDLDYPDITKKSEFFKIINTNQNSTIIRQNLHDNFTIQTQLDSTCVG